MKKNILISGSIGLVAVLAAIFLNPSKNDISYYQARQSVILENDANGAIEWMNQLRANQNTGVIDPQDVLNARNKTAALNVKRKSGSVNALGLEWTNMGPSDNGGRTRAILIDKDNPDIMYAGCVSGGLFKTTTGGSSWDPVNDTLNNLAVVSLAQAQGSGDIYMGTGEGMYYAASGSRSQGILGAGIYKSTDGGNTFTILPNTIPTPNTVGSAFAAVGKLAVDPNNDNRVYAATISGLYVSDDAGDTWTKARSGAFNRATDMVVASNGTVWLKEGSSIYNSTTGDVGSFVSVNSSSNLPTSGPRARIAVSPEDPNYVYVVTTSSGGSFNQAWQSKDGGQSWTVIGSFSSTLDPHSGQGTYNNALAVSPMDKERIFVGGVSFYEWSAAGGWQQAASQNDAPTNPFYVHADNHEIVFHPNDPMTIFVGNDGGIFKSVNNGITWTHEVREYVTTQFYNIGVGVNGELMGGTQDNGTLYVDPNAAQSRSGERTASISFRGVLVDGDGGYAAISRLDPDVSFKAMQYGRIGRSIDNVESFSYVLSDEMDPNLIAGTSAFSAFVTPFTLWEKLDDPNSQDSIVFRADSASLSAGFGNGGATYTGTMPNDQGVAQFLVDGFVIRTGNLEVRSDATGNLIGDGSGTFDSSTGDFVVTFINPVNLEIRAKAAVRYSAGAELSLQSAINELPISFTLPSALEPGDSVLVQDRAQSMYFVGLTGRSVATGAVDLNENGGVWMTRGVLSNINLTPTYYQVAKVGNGVTPSLIEVSADGDMAWIGTSNGQVIRLSNLNNARDEASTSIRDEYVAGAITAPNTSVIVRTNISVPAGSRTITDIAVHPTDPDKVVITAGSYGNSTHVFYSSNGTAASPTFTSAQGDLPAMPVYSALFNSMSGNTNQLLVGTDLGVFTTDDISAGSSVSWTQEINGMANVPVFDLVQDRAVRFDIKDSNDFQGSIYAGTHGRGFYKTASTANYISVEEGVAVQDEDAVEGLSIYPNPAANSFNIELDLLETTEVTLSIRDFAGRLVKTQKFGKLQKDITELEINIANLSRGNYIVTLQTGSIVQSQKLIVTK